MSWNNERPTAQGFYQQALTEADRMQMDLARHLPTLDDEIAVLRVRLKRALASNPEDFEVLYRGLGLLVRMVAAQHRIAPGEQKQLGDALAHAINSLGEQFFPERYHEE